MANRGNNHSARRAGKLDEAAWLLGNAAAIQARAGGGTGRNAAAVFGACRARSGLVIQSTLSVDSVRLTELRELPQRFLALAHVVFVPAAWV